MIRPPASKYPPYPEIRLDDRRWPDRRIVRPPAWCSVDLRDGNQALSAPMDVPQKRAMFDALVAVGFKEIEIGFPAASRADFDFCRWLIEARRIPPDVTVQVLVQARAHLIADTFDALEGVPRAIVHLYNSTSTLQREVVFRTDKAGVKQIAVDGAEMVRERALASPDTAWTLQYSPESFTGTEVEYALEVCDAVREAWQPTPDHKVIINLPATVELSTPNVYADLIEWMDCRLTRRDTLVLSVHPHNDRGTAVAAAELALMAGAERVEGTLFGNGERTGNVDLVTLALNMYAQGVDPGLDLSDVPALASCAERCTRLPVHPRHPYAGALVFTAFSGSHQDAIRKGFGAQTSAGPWRVPYLAIDPRDIGRTYDAIVRVNSQSGKGGVAFVLEREYGIVLEPDRQVEFSRTIQDISDRTGDEVTADQIWNAFREHYNDPFSGRWRFSAHDSSVPDPPSEWIQQLELRGNDVRVCEVIVQAGGARVDVTIAARFDGRDYPVEGSPIADEVSYLRLDGWRISGTAKKRGRVMFTEVLEAAEDGGRLMAELTFQSELGGSTHRAVFLRDRAQAGRLGPATRPRWPFR